MRYFLSAALGAALTLPAIAVDQGTSPAPIVSPAPSVGTTTGGMHDPVNTVCPVCGSAVDAERQPIAVWDQQGGQWLAVGVDNDAHAAVIRQQPDKYAMAARQNSRASDLEGATGSTSGLMGGTGKPAESGNDEAMHRRDRASALEFNEERGSDVAAEQPGKGAERDLQEHQDLQNRAGGLEFNPEQADEAMSSGSSAGMEPSHGTFNRGKQAESDDLDSAIDSTDNGRASAVEFNKLERGAIESED
jgi:hypothetical protein